MEQDSDDEFPSDFLAALSAEQRGTSESRHATYSDDNDIDEASLCTFSDEDEEYLLQPVRSSIVLDIHRGSTTTRHSQPSASGVKQPCHPARRRSGVEDQIDQIQDILAAEEADISIDQVDSVVMEEDCYSHIDGCLAEDACPEQSVHSSDIPQEVPLGTRSLSCDLESEVIIQDDAIDQIAEEDIVHCVDVELSPVSTSIPNQLPTQPDPFSARSLGATKDAISQEGLKRISAELTPSQLFTQTMSRIMKEENPNFASDAKLRLGRAGSISFDLATDDGQSVQSKPSFKSSISMDSKRGSFMRRGSSIQIGNDVVPLGNMYTDTSSNQKRTPKRRSTVGNTVQLRDLLGAPRMTKNESFQEKTKSQWTSGQLLQKRNLERQCLGAFRTHIASPLNETGTNVLNFECFEYFLQDMFCLPVSSDTEVIKQVREVAFLTANALGGEKAPKLEHSLRSLTKEKLGFRALVTGVALGGCMLLVLIAHGLYKFEDRDLNKAIADLRLAKLQNKIHHVSQGFDQLNDHDQTMDFHHTIDSLDYDNNMYRLEQKRKAVAEESEREFRRLHPFSPQIGRPPPPPPSSQATRMAPPPPPPPPHHFENEWDYQNDSIDGEESRSNQSNAGFENRLERSWSMNFTPFAANSTDELSTDETFVPYTPIKYEPGPRIETSVFERLYSRRKLALTPGKFPINSNSINDVMDDDASLITIDSSVCGNLMPAFPQSMRATKSRGLIRSFAEIEEAEIKQQCTFKPKIVPCPFVSQRSIKTILDIVNPSELPPPVVSVIIDDVVEDARAEFRTVLSDLVEPGLPVYFYNRRFPPLCAKTNIPLQQHKNDINIPAAPPLPPPDYFQVIADVNADVSAAMEGTNIHSRAHSVLKRSNSILKGAPVEADPADWSGLLVELTTKIGGGLLRLNSVTDIKDVKKLEPTKKKGKKKAFKNVMEEMNDFLKRYKSMEDSSSDESEIEHEEAVVETAPLSDKKSRRTVLVPRADMTPAGAFRQMKAAVKVGISKIPPPPPLPGTENDYIEPPPVPARVYPNSKAHRRASADKKDAEDQASRESISESGNLTDLLAVAMGRTTFGGKLEGDMSGDVASAFDDNGVLDPGYYLPAPEDVVVHRAQLLFRGITGEDIELDEEVLAHLELVGAMKRPPPVQAITKRGSTSSANNIRNGDMNDVSGIWRGKLTVNDLPTPKSYNHTVDKLRAANEVRLEKKRTEWATGMRNYGEFPVDGAEDTKGPQKASSGASINTSMTSTMNLTVIEEFTHHIDTRSAEAKKMLNIKTYRKRNGPSDADHLPLQSRISEKMAAKSPYSQQGGEGLAAAYWTTTLRDYDNPRPHYDKSAVNSDTSVASFATVTTNITLSKKLPVKPCAPKFNISKVEQRRLSQQKKDKEDEAIRAAEKKRIKERLHRQAIPTKPTISAAQYREKIADKYSNRPDVGFNVNQMTRLSARGFEASHGVSPSKYIACDLSNNQAQLWPNQWYPSQTDHFADDMSSLVSSPPMSYLDGMSGFDTPRVSLLDDEDTSYLNLNNTQNISPDSNSQHLAEVDEDQYYEDNAAPVSFVGRPSKSKPFMAPPSSRGIVRQFPPPILSPVEKTYNPGPNFPSPPPPPPPSGLLNSLDNESAKRQVKPPPPPPKAAGSRGVPPPPPPPSPTPHGSAGSKQPLVSSRPPPPPPPAMKLAHHQPVVPQRRNIWGRPSAADDDYSLGENSTESSAFYESNYLMSPGTQ